MKRKIGLALMALVILAVLSACQPRQPELEGLQTAQQGQIIYQTPTTPPTQPPQSPDTADEPEETDWDSVNNPQEEEGITPDTLALADANVQTTQWPYAGATPMPLDPIDMPTPTPRPKLAFTYQTVEAANLGITFDAPLGWVRDDSQDSSIILWEPESEIKDNYRAFLSIEVRSTGSTLSKSEMKNLVGGIFDTLGAGYDKWEPKVAADRTLMGEAGMYNDYRGVMMDGTIVRGRVHVASVNKKTVTVHLSCPAGFNQDYMDNVYVKLRATLKELK